MFCDDFIEISLKLINCNNVYYISMKEKRDREQLKMIVNGNKSWIVGACNDVLYL